MSWKFKQTNHRSVSATAPGGICFLKTTNYFSILTLFVCVGDCGVIPCEPVALW